MFFCFTKANSIECARNYKRSHTHTYTHILQSTSTRVYFLFRKLHADRSVVALNKMSYRSSEGKKEEFRRYLESNHVIDALTRVLVNLYEESDKPENPVEYIKKVLGGASTADYEALQQENACLRAEVESLKKKMSEMQGQ